MHNKLVKFGFYEDFYRKLMNIYLKLTNYETLEIVSQDSAFFRNILAKNCKRNPQYYNKSGLKIHSIVDTNRVPISIEITECTDHDSQYIESGLQHLYLNDENFYNNFKKSLLVKSLYVVDSPVWVPAFFALVPHRPQLRWRNLARKIGVRRLLPQS